MRQQQQVRRKLFETVLLEEDAMESELRSETPFSVSLSLSSTPELPYEMVPMRNAIFISIYTLINCRTFFWIGSNKN